MKRYYIDFGRESVPQVRELSQQEYNLIESIIETAQRGTIIEYPFTFNDLFDNYLVYSQLKTRKQREKYLNETLYKKYFNVNNCVVEYFAAELEIYYNS